MTIRGIRGSDRAALEDILRAAFRSDEVAVALELIDEAIAGSRDYEILVAEAPRDVDVTIGGYICFGPTPMTAATYDLYWLASHPEARGRGVASSLVERMEAELRARGATGIRVETSESEGYGAARRFYARHDYPEVAHLVDFYSEGDGLIILYKRMR